MTQKTYYILLSEELSLQSLIKEMICNAVDLYIQSQALCPLKNTLAYHLFSNIFRYELVLFSYFTLSIRDYNLACFEGLYNSSS